MAYRVHASGAVSSASMNANQLDAIFDSNLVGTRATARLRLGLRLGLRLRLRLRLRLGLRLRLRLGLRLRPRLRLRLRRERPATPRAAAL